MSQISTIYDGIVTRLTTLFPNHNRLGNPYDLEVNPDTMLSIGWGLAVGPAANTERLVGCQVSLLRELTVYLTRRYHALENDAATKATTEKLLLEDLKTLVNDAENNYGIDDASTIIKYVGDGGIEPVRESQENYLHLAVNLTAEYFETIT